AISDLAVTGLLFTLVIPRADATAWLGALRSALTEAKPPADTRLALRLSAGLATWFNGLRHRHATLSLDSTLELIKLLLPLSDYLHANKPPRQSVPAIARILAIAGTAV